MRSERFAAALCAGAVPAAEAAMLADFPSGAGAAASDADASEAGKGASEVGKDVSVAEASTSKGGEGISKAGEDASVAEASASKMSAPGVTPKGTDRSPKQERERLKQEAKRRAAEALRTATDALLNVPAAERTERMFGRLSALDALHGRRIHRDALTHDSQHSVAKARTINALPPRKKKPSGRCDGQGCERACTAGAYAAGGGAYR